MDISGYEMMNIILYTVDFFRDSANGDDKFVDVNSNDTK